MGVYDVRSRYRAESGGRLFGPFEAGEVVELDDEDAAWVNRDAPGTLVPAPSRPDPGVAERSPERARKGPRRNRAVAAAPADRAEPETAESEVGEV